MGDIFVLCTLTIFILAWHCINSVICDIGKSPIPPLYVFVLPVCYAFYDDIYVVCTLLYIKYVATETIYILYLLFYSTVTEAA